MCRICKYANSGWILALQEVQQSTVMSKLKRGPLQKGMITGLINEKSTNYEKDNTFDSSDSVSCVLYKN